MRKPARDDMKRLFGGVSRGYWGRDEKPALRIMHKAGIQGQVGQESNLQPAVLEPRVRESMGVHAMSLHVAIRHR
jgi:hypothetical protein